MNQGFFIEYFRRFGPDFRIPFKIKACNLSPFRFAQKQIAYNLIIIFMPETDFINAVSIENLDFLNCRIRYLPSQLLAQEPEQREVYSIFDKTHSLDKQG